MLLLLRSTTVVDNRWGLMTQIETDRARQVSGSRVPPSVIEAEESLIGAMLLSPEAVSVAFENVQPEDFYRPLHGQIFSAIIAPACASAMIALKI